MLHSNIIKYAERKDYLPFDDEKSKQMSWDIVNSINEQIPDEEGVILWNLGDLFYGRLFGECTLDQLKAFIDVMKGKHRKLNIVLGNHDRQFNHFRKSKADWDKIKPFDKNSPLEDIFKHLGFDKVYDRPVLFGDGRIQFILSHEPVYIKANYSNFINIHGHTHQASLVPEDEKGNTKYFCYTLENHKMVRKAYADSNRDVPNLEFKKDYQNWLTKANLYHNACWDAPEHLYKVEDLDALIKSLTK